MSVFRYFPPRGSVRVRVKVRVRTPRCGSVRVRNAGCASFQIISDPWVG